MILIIDMNQQHNLTYLEFVRPIEQIAKNYSEVVVKNYMETSISDCEKADKIIISGTTLRETKYLENFQSQKWLEKCQKPILGICAGFQLIGLYFGCKLTKESEIGMTQIKTTQDNPLFTGEFQAYELHNLAINYTDDFEILAKSNLCTQAVKHKTKEIYGVLFHPEVRNEKIIEKFLTLQ